MVNKTPATPIRNTQPPPAGIASGCSHMIAPNAITSADMDPKSGQMLGGRI